MLQKAVPLFKVSIHEACWFYRLSYIVSPGIWATGTAPSIDLAQKRSETRPLLLLLVLALDGIGVVLPKGLALASDPEWAIHATSSIDHAAHAF